MDEISPAVALTLSLANTMCDSGISSTLDITEMKNVTGAVDMLSHQKDQIYSNGEVEDVSEDKTLSEARSLSSDLGVAVQESEEDEVLVVSDDATIISEGLIVVDARSEITLPDTDNGRVLATAIIINETTIDQVPTAEVLITSLNHDVSMEATASEVVIRLPEETHHNVARGSRSVYELECIPLWGTVSICGGRSEMEDAVSALPHCLKIPIKMLMGDHEGMSPSLTHLTSHFFGVYDGHGGAQVCFKR